MDKDLALDHNFNIGSYVLSSYFPRNGLILKLNSLEQKLEGMVFFCFCLKECVIF